MNIPIDLSLYLPRRTRRSAEAGIAQLWPRGQRARGCPLLALGAGGAQQSGLRVQFRADCVDCAMVLWPQPAGTAAEGHPLPLPCPRTVREWRYMGATAANLCCTMPWRAGLLRLLPTNRAQTRTQPLTVEILRLSVDFSIIKLIIFTFSMGKCAWISHLEPHRMVAIAQFG